MSGDPFAFGPIAVGPEEAGALAAVHALAYAPPHERPWGAASIAALLASPGVAALAVAAEEGHGFLGFVMVRVVADEAEVLTLAVAPAFLRQGRGAALMRAAAALAVATGASRLHLEVAEDNAAALALYAGLGFRAAGRRRAYYPRDAGRAVDALALVLDFDAA